MRAAEAFAETAAHASDRGDGGIVRLTAATGMVRHVLAPLVGELARVHPGIRVEVTGRAREHIDRERAAQRWTRTGTALARRPSMREK